MRKPTRLFTSEHAVTTYYHEVPDGTTLDQIQDPSYWSHVAHQFKPRFRILCDAEDGTWTATLFVRAVGKVEVFVAVESHNQFVTAKKSSTSKTAYFVKWRNPKDKFAVMLKDGQQETVVEKGFDIGEQAQEWIDKHVAAAKTAA